MVDRGRLTPHGKAQRLALIRASLEYEDLRDADVIVEAVFEDMDAQAQDLRAARCVAKPGAVLATNTSTLDIEQIAAATRRPQDVIGMHFFSPANVMPLLEVVRTERNLAGDDPHRRWISPSRCARRRCSRRSAMASSATA